MSKVLIFPKSLVKILVNSFKMAIDNDFDIVLSYKDKKGKVFHVSNVENYQDILRK